MVFQKLPLHEAHSLGSTTSVESISIAPKTNIGVSNNPYIQFKVYDIPATVSLEDFCKSEPQAIERGGALIYVIDAKATPYDKACEYFKTAVVTMLQHIPKINLEVFIHKVDGDIFTKGDEYKLGKCGHVEP